MSEKKVIHATVYDPTGKTLFKSKATDKAEVRTVTCTSSDKCGYFAAGSCILTDSILHTCIYGRRGISQGPSKRAKGCHTWAEEKREQYKDVLWKMKGAPRKMTVIGDHVYLPYSFMSMNENVSFIEHNKFFASGKPFIPINLFNVGTIRNILEFRPRAWNGETIEAYRKEEIPRFVLHLKEVFPELYDVAAQEIPAIGAIMEKSTMVGRKALVHSLKPGTVVTQYHDSKAIETKHWTWDGEWLESTDAGHSFAITKYDEAIVRIKPKAGESIVITNDSQVDSDTIYVN